jgi:hypothetical protein
VRKEDQEQENNMSNRIRELFSHATLVLAPPPALSCFLLRCTKGRSGRRAQAVRLAAAARASAAAARLPAAAAAGRPLLPAAAAATAAAAAAASPRLGAAAAPPRGYRPSTRRARRRVARGGRRRRALCPPQHRVPRLQHVCEEAAALRLTPALRAVQAGLQGVGEAQPALGAGEADVKEAPLLGQRLGG